jgi:hypothetical protein
LVAAQPSSFHRKLQFWKNRVTWAVQQPDPPVPAPKVFKPKHQLPHILDYTKDPGPEFWEKFPKNLRKSGKSTICPDKLKLRNLAWAVGYKNAETLSTVCKDLTDGADIGCRGSARNPTVSSNAPSALEFKGQVTDSVADWVTAGFAAGPFPPSDRPPSAKVNGMMCRQKPNGSARIILNFSAPKGSCVNDGIRSEDFPTTMSSTRKWLEVLDKAGRGALIAKLDWASAYKHVAVRVEDIDLQFFSWLGMDFVELCLVFGCRSSAGIYDRLAKVVLAIVLLYSKFPEDMVCQYLDDVCAAAAAGSTDLHQFQAAYREVAEHLGVLLAPTTDPDKAFEPTTAGVVLGVYYDTVAWTWKIPTEKLARLLAQIRAALSSENMQLFEIWSLVGRILHYAPLVPSGKFNISALIAAHGSSMDKNAWVPVPPLFKQQLHFWWTMLKTMDSVASIPLPERFPAWTVEFYTDAAGGSLSSLGHGSGGHSGPWWFYVPWGHRINCGMRGHDGKRFSRKLSALELVGPLICVAAASHLCRLRPVRVWVDNAGSVGIWRKGYSTTCQLCTTLVNAIARVAAAIGCTLTIDKITRCSDTGAVLADLLSKGQFPAFYSTWPTDKPRATEPAWIPPAILAWLDHPAVDSLLGDRILKQIADKGLL